MIHRDQIIKFIYSTISEDLLAKSLLKDELANGVQFLGGEQVNKVTLGTSLNQDFLNEAIAAKSNFCIFHHGFDVRTFQSRYLQFSQKRLNLIIKNNLTIAAFHYCLDAHPKIGNNAVIAQKLGATLGEPLFEDWGFVAHFDQPQDIQALSKRCAALFEHDVFAVYSGPTKISTIGIVSGAGKPSAENLTEMAAAGIQLFITGEASESIPHKMKESGINYFACGHYATEVFGVQELGRVIKAKFKDTLAVEFLDIPNPI